MTEMAPALEAAELETTFARIAALDAAFAARVVDAVDPAWLDARALARPGSAALDAVLERIMLPYDGVRSAHVAAAFFVNTYAWLLPLAATAAYLTERRVPDLAPANVVLRVREPAENHGAFELGFRSGRMAVLPDDPAAGQPDVVVVADASTLRERLRTQIEAHMAPLVAAVQARTGFGARGQWNLVADDCAAVFLWVGERIGAVERACAEGSALVSAPGSPMARSRTGYFRLEAGDSCQTFRARGGCCLYYKVPGRTNCATCALLPDAERERRLRETMAAARAV